MNNFTIEEVKKFVEENDIKFIRLAFCNIFGVLKNISIMPSELSRAFEEGIPFDASAVKGFMNVEDSDLFLVPDSSTMSILPWRPTQGRVVRFFCDIKMLDGAPFECNGRLLLRQAIDYAAKMGYTVKIGTECEFYLFELDEHGEPTLKPHDKAGYCDTAPLDKGENVRREICLTLEEMGIKPEMSHHEQGAGQHEVDFRYSEALSAADNLVTFKYVVKNIAARNGLYASFMPKPVQGSSGSGMHINLSLSRNDKNIFDLTKNKLNEESTEFVAGIMDRIQEIAVFTNPISNSYARLGEFSAPKFVTWSHGNRSQLIRIPASQGELRRMELRNPDPSCSPYLTFALLIYAGMEGIKEKKVLETATNCNLYEANENVTENLRKIPENLGQAISIAKASDFVKSHLPSDTIARYLSDKENDWKKYINAEDKNKFELDMYFKKL